MKEANTRKPGFWRYRGTAFSCFLIQNAYKPLAVTASFMARLTDERARNERALIQQTE